MTTPDFLSYYFSDLDFQLVLKDNKFIMCTQTMEKRRGLDPSLREQTHPASALSNLWDEKQVETTNIPPASQTILLVLGAAMILH